jgi:hypothetical protein
MPRGCELDVDLVEAENTYATKKVILEVELEVGVLLDGLEDLGVITRLGTYLDTLCGDLVGQIVSTYSSISSIGSVRLYLRTAMVACELLARELSHYQQPCLPAKMTMLYSDMMILIYSFMM